MNEFIDMYEFHRYHTFVMLRKNRLLVADEVWLTVARMHQMRPREEAFSAAEIIAEAERANLSGEIRPGVNTHVRAHSVAGKRPNPGRYRMLFELPDGRLRLYRPGDPAHADRNGKITPNREELPAEYHRYLDWYERVYCAGAAAGAPIGRSFIDRLSGLGKSIWTGTSADEYVASQRKGWDA